MIRSLPFVPLRRALTLSLLAGLAACQAEAPKPVASNSCLTERADFIAATDLSTLPADPAGGADGYYAALRRATADSAQEARNLSVDLDRDADAADRVTSSFATLKACRFDRAEEIRSGVAAGTVPTLQMAPLLDGERASFLNEINLAQAAAGRLVQHGQILRQVADRLAATAPGIDLKVARAAAAAPPPAQPYVATATVPIYAKPAATGTRVANLRRAQRVQGPGGQGPAGWVQLTLNDGSTGYVEAAALRPAQPNPSAVKAAAKAEATRDAAGDPIATAALMARVGLPDRQQALTSLIDGSSEAMAQAFNPSSPAVAASDAPPAGEP